VTDADALLDVEQVAALLGVSTRTIKRLTVAGKRGGIPFVRIGRQLRFRPLAIERWLRESEKNAVTA
jgi:excisionase family DNA binding protein